LLSQKRGNSWGTTKATASVILSLCEYIIKEKLEPLQNDINITASLNGKNIHKWEIKKETPVTESKFSVLLKNPKLKPGANKLTLKKIGKGEIFYTAALSGYLTGNVIKKQEFSDNNRKLKIRREFYRTTRIFDRKGYPYLSIQKLDENDSVKVGEEILVQLSIESSGLQFVILEDPLPSGFEVLKPHVNIDVSRWYRYYSHQERRDEKMVYFYNNLNKGKNEIFYLIRAEIEGQFRVNPAVIYAMYAPEITSNSASRKIIITSD
jgi:uncharacterized protein YfaS (alpha-2-macroglobulin family)